jgi:hypothetical protein
MLPEVSLSAKRRETEAIVENSLLLSREIASLVGRHAAKDEKTGFRVFASCKVGRKRKNNLSKSL